MAANKWKTVDDLPIHAFSNKECTMTPSPELREYLEYMVEHHEEDLEYLWRHTQQYTRHGGCYGMAWHVWLRKLKKDLTKQKETK